MYKLQKCKLLINDEKIQCAIQNLDECTEQVSSENDGYHNERLWNIIEESKKNIEDYILPSNEKLMEILYDNACAHANNGGWSEFGTKLDSNLNKLILVNKAERRIEVATKLFAEYADKTHSSEIQNMKNKIEGILK